MTALFFDLDGTLTDSRVGITRCMQHALERLSIAPPPGSALERFIGPPLSHAFAELLGSQDEVRIAQAIALYRERYDEIGIYENELYPGIADSLHRLQEESHSLALVTSKPTVYAERILDHFELACFFEGCHGADLAGTRSHKEVLVRAALASGSIAPGDAWMIGDREHDVLGARAAGVRSVGVTWGFGSEQELQSAAADRIVHSTDALVSLFTAAGS